MVSITKRILPRPATQQGASATATSNNIPTHISHVEEEHHPTAPTETERPKSLELPLRLVLVHRELRPSDMPSEEKLFDV